MRLLRRSVAPLLATMLLAACNLDSSVRVPDPIDPLLDNWAPALGVNFSNMTKTASGLWIQDTQVGTGEAATATSTIVVRYSGFLPNGFNFDSNLNAANPTEFELDELIDAWQEGIPGMRVGGKRRLIAPPSLGFGRDGFPSAGIPGNSNLLFDLELVSITP